MHRKRPRVMHCLLALGISLLPVPYSVSRAQTITSSGLNTSVSAPIVSIPSGKIQINITDGTRPGGGANLFHSFGEFNVPTNTTANFLNNTGLPTSNILGRVTGGNLSSVYGTIQTTGFEGANLFLMNPAGFLFGPNATVNVAGMVAFTTADYLRLADGARFNAIPNAPADALLSAAPVVAFGFLGKNPRAITVQGSELKVAGPLAELPESGDLSGLTFANGAIRYPANLSLIGGDITVQGGTVAAPGADVTLVSVGRPSNAKVGAEVSLAGTPTGFGTMGTVTLSQGSVIDASNGLFAPNVAVGSVVIRGGQVVLDTATIRSGAARTLTETPTITVESLGSIDMRNSSVSTSGEFGQAGTVDLTAGKDIRLTDSSVSTFTMLGPSGGSITLTAASISLRGSTLVTRRDFSGGMIRLNATKAITLTNTDISAFSDLGEGGTILINGGGLFTAQQTILDAWGSQTGGTIQITASKIALTDSQLQAWGSQHGGLITLDAKTTTLTNSQLVSAQFSSFNLYGDATGGTIRITSPMFKQIGSVLDAASRSDDAAGGGTVTINGVIQP
jgi:filamentous hemagglutinin family protein